MTLCLLFTVQKEFKTLAFEINNEKNRECKALDDGGSESIRVECENKRERRLKSERGMEVWGVGMRLRRKESKKEVCSRRPTRPI